MRRIRFSVLFSIALAFTFLARRAVFAQEEGGDTHSRLEVIAAKVDQETARLTELEQRRVKLSGEMSSLNKSVAESQRTLTNLKSKNDALERDRATIEKEAQDTDRRLIELKVLTMQRVRSLAMQRKDRLIEQVVLRETGESFSRRVFFFKKIREQDDSLTRDLQKLFSQKKDHIIELKSLLDQQKKIEKDRAQQQRSLEEKVRKLDQVKRTLLEEKAKAEQGLAELRAEALRLETVMVGLTGGVQEDAEGSSSTENTEPTHAPIITVTFSGKGLRSNGHNPPLEGKVLQRYDQTKGKGFESFVKSKGIEIQAAQGAAVTAIERGKVMYRGIMPGYGQIVILDHGDREYSLYGRLAETKVEQGAVVERGAELARTGAGDDLGRNFYFEIRKNGKPLNPALFISAYH